MIFLISMSKLQYPHYYVVDAVFCRDVLLVIEGLKRIIGYVSRRTPFFYEWKHYNEAHKLLDLIAYYGVIYLNEQDLISIEHKFEFASFENDISTTCLNEILDELQFNIKRLQVEYILFEKSLSDLCSDVKLLSDYVNIFWERFKPMLKFNEEYRFRVHDIYAEEVVSTFNDLVKLFKQLSHEQ